MPLLPASSTIDNMLRLQNVAIIFSSRLGRAHVWPSAAVGISRQYSGLEICIASASICLIIKQFPHLCSTNSYACYELPCPSLSFVASKVLSNGTRIIYIHIRQNILATLSVDTKNSGSTAQEEIVTLNMWCPLVDTDVPASTKADTIIPDALQHSENVVLLHEALGVSSFTEQAQSDLCQSVNISDTDSIAPISASGEDLDRMVSLCTQTSISTQPCTTRQSQRQQRRVGGHQNNTNSTAHYHVEQERCTHVVQNSKQPKKLPTPAEVDQTLWRNAESQAEFWGKEFGVSDARSPTPMSTSIKQSLTKQIQSKNAWEDFALRNGGPKRRSPQACHAATAVKVPQSATVAAQKPSIDTGGYCMDPFRDYTKADGGERQARKPRQKMGAGKDRVFVVPSPVQATFIPHTRNSPAEQQKPFLKNRVRSVEHQHW